MLNCPPLEPLELLNSDCLKMLNCIAPGTDVTKNESENMSKFLAHLLKICQQSRYPEICWLDVKMELMLKLFDRFDASVFDSKAQVFDIGSPMLRPRSSISHPTFYAKVQVFDIRSPMLRPRSSDLDLQPENRIHESDLGTIKNRQRNVCQYCTCVADLGTVLS